MDRIAIDVGTEYVGLAKWDGRTLTVRKRPAQLPEVGWPAWIDALAPASRFEVLFRWPAGEASEALCSQAVDRWAGLHGASGVRVLTEDSSISPAMAAARNASNRERLGRVVAVEIGARHCTSGLVDRTGRAIAMKERTWAREAVPSAESLADSIRECLRNESSVGYDALSELTLVCGGGDGPPVAAALAQACGLGSVLIPEHAGAMATIGMLLADMVIRFEESFGATPLEMDALRRAFGRLMDRASGAITREGYDLDDAVCERSALLGVASDDAAIEVDCDDLADESGLLSRFQEQYDVGRRVNRSKSAVEVRAARIKVTIETRKPEFPIAPAPDRGLEATVLSEPANGAAILPGFFAYSRETLPAGVDISGPAAICEPYTTTIVPKNWKARRSAAGGLMLRKHSD